MSMCRRSKLVKHKEKTASHDLVLCAEMHPSRPYRSRQGSGSDRELAIKNDSATKSAQSLIACVSVLCRC